MLTTLGLATLAGLLSTLSPCVLPLVPIVLAARGENLGAVALTMLGFGLGAAAPLLLLGLLSREALARRRGGLAAFGQGAKAALGALLAVLGLLVLSGLDKRAEAWAVAASPDWLTALTVSY
ncbi:hypothetical protein [Methylobacterium hispanicum]|uniref:hypothetical protein n=1 Tax=Methylobacterium hispanicum TaxID=270350 RepID=UPI002F35512C